MTAIERIYSYFERNSDLRVLFIFNNEFLALELAEVKWKEGYRFVDFKGDWFTVKYNLDNAWADDKVVLYFHQESPLQRKSLSEKFPLLDVLTANMEYQSQDYTAFMQQYGLPDTDIPLMRFVERNITALQSDRMQRMFVPYYQEHSISAEKLARGFISSYMGVQRILEWDEIILRVILLGRSVEKQKRIDFFVRLRKCREAADALVQRLSDVFGTAFDDNTEEKVADVVKALKYNAIVQNLAPVQADNYKQWRIDSSLALQQMNRILELALSQEKWADALMEVMDELGGGIREDELICWYGADADYYFVTPRLCGPIVAELLKDRIATEPEAVIRRLEDLVLKLSGRSVTSSAVEWCLTVGRYYQKVLSPGSFTLNTPDEYVTRYQEDYYLIDQLYRLATEQYFKVDSSCGLFADIQQAKHGLDIHYSRLCDLMNQEWIHCIRETGGMGGVHLPRQQDFYQDHIRPIQKKVAVIVSDALRYEVAQELIGELAKSKHIATLKAMLAMLPTETKYGKPALLPHRELKFCGQGESPDMSVDGYILNTTERRSEHLQRYCDGAVCVSFETVAEYNKEKNREIFSLKHPLVYIFHDAIDKTGHDGTARQVTQACREAIGELVKMINHILDRVTEVYVTSDHGFLFNDIDFGEKDKHRIGEEALERSTRYYLTRSEAEAAGMVKFPIGEVSGIENGSGVYVAVPQGTNRLAAPSGGYKFTHGGASMQELIIPVIVCRKERTDSKQPVGVMLLDRRLSMQASRLRFKLLQTEAVSMDIKERHIRVALYHQDEPVTPVKDILLDKTDPLLDNRKIQVDLTLNRNVDARILQLRVFDATDTLNPLIKENVTNNTLIEHDFDLE